jgi:probable blue pigment (indigoidine) exporter
VILIFILYALLAATFTIAKTTLLYGSPLLVLTLRFVLGGGVLVLLAHAGRLIDWRRVCHDRWWFVATLLTHVYLAFLLEFWALSRLTSAKTSIVYASTPFIAALFSYVLYGERLAWRQVLGMIVGFCSLLPLVGFDGLSGGVTLADLVLFAAVVSASGAWFLVKKLMAQGHHLFAINSLAMFGAGLLFVPTLFASDADAVCRVASWPHLAFWIAALVVLSQGIVYNLYAYLLRHYSITLVTLWGFTCPVFSSVYGALFLGETLTWQAGCALAGISAGLWIFTMPSFEKSGE